MKVILLSVLVLMLSNAALAKEKSTRKPSQAGANIGKDYSEDFAQANLVKASAEQKQLIYRELLGSLDSKLTVNGEEASSSYGDVKNMTQAMNEIFASAKKFKVPVEVKIDKASGVCDVTTTTGKEGQGEVHKLQFKCELDKNNSLELSHFNYLEIG